MSWITVVNNVGWLICSRPRSEYSDLKEETDPRKFCEIFILLVPSLSIVTLNTVRVEATVDVRKWLWISASYLCSPDSKWSVFWFVLFCLHGHTSSPEHITFCVRTAEILLLKLSGKLAHPFHLSTAQSAYDYQGKPNKFYFNVEVSPCTFKLFV